MKSFTDKIQNKDSQLIKELSELLSNYNTDREATAILTGNSNEIRPLPSENRGVRVGGGNPHKLYNKISESVIDNFKAGKVSEAINLDQYIESATTGIYGRNKAI